MSIVHCAYRFDPQSAPGAVPRDVRALREEAAALAAQPRWVETLEKLHFDPGWLDPQEGQLADCVLVVLVPALTPVTSLSRREPHAWFALEQRLAAAGWPPDDVSLLVRGQPLELLAERFAPELAPWLKGSTRVGWLDAATISRLRLALEAQRDALGTLADDAIAMLDAAEMQALLVHFD